LARKHSCLPSAQNRRNQENLEVAFAIGVAVITLGILIIAAALLVRNNVSLAAAEKARTNEAAILRATLETVRDGIAYFASDGLLCAFNANFFRLLDLPESLAMVRKTTLAQLQKVEALRQQRFLLPPAAGRDPVESQHMSWAGRESISIKRPSPPAAF